MGLEFDAAAEGLVISGVVRSGASDKAGVKPGDRVVKVNGEDVEELDFRGAVAKIVAAEWPKTLQFRRAEEVVQDDPEVRLSCWLLWSCCLRLWVRLCVCACVCVCVCVCVCCCMPSCRRVGETSREWVWV